MRAEDIDSSTSQEQTVKIISVPKDNVAKWVAIIGLVVNIVLIFFTYKLWKEAINASQTANKALEQASNAANSAKASADEAHIANGISDKNYYLSERSFESGKELSNKSLNAQINSIKETQKEFEAINQRTGVAPVAVAPVANAAESPAVRRLHASHHDEHDDHDQHQADATARVVAPGTAVRPGGQGADQDQQQDDQKDER